MMKVISNAKCLALFKKIILYCWGAGIKLSFKAHLPFSAESWTIVWFCFKLWMMPLPCMWNRVGI